MFMKCPISRCCARPRFVISRKTDKSSSQNLQIRTKRRVWKMDYDHDDLAAGLAQKPLTQKACKSQTRHSLCLAILAPPRAGRAGRPLLAFVQSNVNVGKSYDSSSSSSNDDGKDCLLLFPSPSLLSCCCAKKFSITPTPLILVPGTNLPVPPLQGSICLGFFFLNYNGILLEASRGCLRFTPSFCRRGPPWPRPRPYNDLFQKSTHTWPLVISYFFGLFLKFIKKIAKRGLDSPPVEFCITSALSSSILGPFWRKHLSHPNFPNILWNRSSNFHFLFLPSPAQIGWILVCQPKSWKDF